MSTTRARLGSVFGFHDLWQPRNNVFFSHRRTVAKLRLLRVAAGEPIFGMTDPFGDGTEPLRERREGDRRILWSIYRNGSDDGGPLSWQGQGFYYPKRLDLLKDELKTEPDRIREVYSVKAKRIEPVGLVYLWPVTG